MRRLPVLFILAAASAALATPVPQTDTSWADWVGDWEGKLTWTSCTAEGAEQASIALDAHDGAVSIDLSPAGSALPQLPLVEESDGWVAQQGDVTVRVRRAASPEKVDKADKRDKRDKRTKRHKSAKLGRGAMIELAIDLDSGCQVRGTLARATVGIPECDQLAGWARIESHCTKLTRPPLENAARLARQRAEWRKARGDVRSKLATQCTARSAKVEQELVDVGCAPHTDPAIGLRGAECQALRGISARLNRCANLPQDQRDAYARQVLVLLAAAQGADQASLPVVEAECKRAREQQYAIARQVGCPP